jgi:hypothetical protein
MGKYYKKYFWKWRIENQSNKTIHKLLKYKKGKIFIKVFLKTEKIKINKSFLNHQNTKRENIYKSIFEKQKK